MNRDYPTFPTFQGYSKQIDFLLTAPEVLQHIDSFIYEPFKYRLEGGGDHIAYYVDIRINELFSTEATPQKLFTRRIISKDTS